MAVVGVVLSGTGIRRGSGSGPEVVEGGEHSVSGIASGHVGRRGRDR